MANCATHNSLVINTYNLQTSKLQNANTICIVLLTDLHSDIYGSANEPLLERIKTAQPDIIALGGDIFDEVNDDTGTVLLLHGLTSIAPVYYVAGNHEYATRNIKRIRSMLNSMRIKILSDSFVSLNIKGNTIILAGADDPGKRRYEDKNYNSKEAAKNFAVLRDIKAYKILLLHRPDLAKNYSDFNFDLLLAGHAHGGQWRIPKLLPNGLFAPGQGFFPKLTGGIYDMGENILIVSAGLTTHRPLIPRINNPPEIVVIKIAPN